MSPNAARPFRVGRALGGVLAVFGSALWIRACADAPRTPGVIDAGDHASPVGTLSGVVHVHTDRSDGRGSVADVVAAARKAKADFIVITDHNRADPPELPPAIAGDPVTLIGSEISTEAGHVLAIGIRPPTFRFSGTLTEVLDDVRHLGGCAFAAHPTSPRGETRFTRHDEPGNWGIEIANGDTAWREASPVSLALAAWSYPANAPFALRKTLGAFESERALWDGLQKRRFVPAIGGTDAHGRIPISRNVSLPVPSYEALFDLVRTVVYLDAPLPPASASARATIARALCQGASAVTIPSYANPKSVVFGARTPDGKFHLAGATVRYEPGTVIHVSGGFPQGVRTRLLRDGVEVAVAAPGIHHDVTTPGVYRVEVYLEGERTPWILTNAISVLTPEMQLAREDAARPKPATLVEGALSIDPFETATSFNPEHDPGSAIELPILDTTGGRGRGAAARLSFRLNATPTPPVWVALSDRTPRDLSANTGISFWMKGDGEYRIWFQIRDLNPASADEGTEAWFASVRTSPAWTLYNIPFKSLRSINRASDGSFDPSKIAHIVFVIDHGAMPFGSTGKIWIDDLRAY